MLAQSPHRVLVVADDERGDAPASRSHASRSSPCRTRARMRLPRAGAPGRTASRYMLPRHPSHAAMSDADDCSVDLGDEQRAGDRTRSARATDRFVVGRAGNRTRGRATTRARRPRRRASPDVSPRHGSPSCDLRERASVSCTRSCGRELDLEPAPTAADEHGVVRGHAGVHDRGESPLLTERTDATEDVSGEPRCVVGLRHVGLLRFDRVRERLQVEVRGNRHDTDDMTAVGRRRDQSS